MMTPTQPARAAALACALACAAVAVGCTSSAELHKAQTSAYKADFAIVYSQTLAVVRKLYPTLTENATAGVIKTAWHPLTIEQEQDTARAPMTNGSTSPNVFSENRVDAVQYFIRFDVYVVGGNPWRVRVVGEASKWEAGGVPMRLHGADEPHWLKGRTDALEVAIYKRLEKYAVPIAQVNAHKKPKQALETSRYRALPPAAARRIAQVLAAAKKGDPAALRPYLSGDFSWSLGGTGSAAEAIAMWRADASVLGKLVEVLEAGCRRAGQRITCPPAYAKGNGFAGYRAGFARVGGDWKMIFFLSGQ